VSLNTQMPPNANPIPRRIRTTDEFQTTTQIRRQCRKTIRIGNEVFRCGSKHGEGLTDHKEAGILKRKGKQDVYYELTWRDAITQRVIRA
jgi:hypothetical protein